MCVFSCMCLPRVCVCALCGSSLFVFMRNIVSCVTYLSLWRRFVDQKGQHILPYMLPYRNMWQDVVYPGTFGIMQLIYYNGKMNTFALDRLQKAKKKKNHNNKSYYLLHRL
uniref:Uncharacterized protein n=1 Tax=Amphiprion percula TaxID=161767 RepID=A0A3P8TNV5_AMPPE